MRAVATVLALSLASCVCTCDADAMVRSLAAPGAVDCGRARTLDEREAILRCVEDAIANGQPFVGAWAGLGRDSEVRTYVVDDGDGEVWMFGFDGGVGGGPQCPNVQGSRCTTPLERRMHLAGETLACDSDPSSQLVLCHR